MGYLIDRNAVLRTQEIVAVVVSSEHRVSSRAVLRDNSLYRTLTRTKTLLKRMKRIG
ncbi:MAG: hypothetical protein HYT88_00330 [Candidatus Omnitrophica bacterium]|nr:hypothetical protein [Candidatus Omnitrophota bacterium]MBI2174966.1 hypothetical protein [Candidatus Omnitrophota bacterium]MBI3010304.1 hypothetical protein [Candidatus Omnitrophota bacterium]